MATIATQPTGGDVAAFLASVPDERRRLDGQALRSLIEEVTGEAPAMWGASIVGFGSQRYTNTTGTNEWFVVGFSPRKAALTVYGIYDDYGPPDPRFEALGPHTTGKGCVYIKRLDDVDHEVLAELVRSAWSAHEGR